MHFKTKLNRIISQKKSILCVGIDPNPELIPAYFFDNIDIYDGVREFCLQLIANTSPYAAAFKINTAYFEALGPLGFQIMFDIAKQVPSDCILIADAKRGDVSHTALQYKIAFFDKMNADAITLNPLMGFDCLEPFSEDPEKCVYSLALTSNPGSADFLLRPFGARPTLARYIAEALKERQDNIPTTLGMVIGATQHDTAQNVLEGFPAAPLLIPGIGHQGGSIPNIITLLESHEGRPLATISRSISYPDYDKAETWDEAVEKITKQYHLQIQPLVQKYV